MRLRTRDAGAPRAAGALCMCHPRRAAACATWSPPAPRASRLRARRRTATACCCALRAKRRRAPARAPLPRLPCPLLHCAGPEEAQTCPTANGVLSALCQAFCKCEEHTMVSLRRPSGCRCRVGAHSCRCLCAALGSWADGLVASAVPPVRKQAVRASRISGSHSRSGTQANDWCRQLQHSQQQTLAVAGRDPLMQSRDAAAFDLEAGSSQGAPSEGAPALDAAAAAAGGGKPAVRAACASIQHGSPYMDV